MLYAYALAVVRRSDGRFLVVQEVDNSGYWLPGGGSVLLTQLHSQFSG